MSLDPVLIQTQERLRELRLDAERRQLAALAACCRPSRWAQWWTAAREAVRARRTPAACCA